MSKDNLQIIERKTIEQLVDELDFLNAQVFAKIKNDVDGGLIKELQEIINTMTNHIEVIDNLKEDSDAQVKDIQIINKKLEDSCKIITQFDAKIEEKMKIYENALDVRTDIIHTKVLDEIQSLKTQLVDSLKLEIDDINKAIKTKIKDIDLKKIDASNRFVSNAVIQLDLFKAAIEKIEKKNRLLSSILSAIGGAVFTSLIFYFFIK